jgi:hypothetical protein
MVSILLEGERVRDVDLSVEVEGGRDEKQISAPQCMPMAHSGAGHIIASDIPNHFRFIDTLFKGFQFQLMTLSF